MIKLFRIHTAVCFLVVFAASAAQAQVQLSADFSTTLRIPDIVSVQESATHLYVLSESEGLVVFRTHADSLQWILTSEGMSDRGRTMQPDVRFAYLYGSGNRLTVLEPTSILGVYSSTFLPAEPFGVSRIGTSLYIAMGETGLGRLPLTDPADFDTAPQMIDTRDTPVFDLVRIGTNLIALDSGQNLLFYDVDGDDIRFSQTVQLDREVQRIHNMNSTLYASDSTGSLYEVRSTGLTRLIAQLSGPVSKITPMGDQILARSTSGILELIESSGRVTTLRADGSNGNYFAVTGQRLWVSNFDELSVNVFFESTQTTPGTDRFRLEPAENIVLPFPRPVLFPLVVHGAAAGEVRFNLRSDAENAQIRGNGFYWQPQSNQIGVTEFVVTATDAEGRTDSTRFQVDVRTFNAPPRFNPVRPMSVIVGELFQLLLRAVDPDGLDRGLIRYHGVDMPDGATISERTGMLTWTPERRQVGVHTFQIIATDQFGAAASLSITMTVRNMSAQPDETGR